MAGFFRFSGPKKRVIRVETKNSDDEDQSRNLYSRPISPNCSPAVPQKPQSRARKYPQKSGGYQSRKYPRDWYPPISGDWSPPGLVTQNRQIMPFSMPKLCCFRPNYAVIMPCIHGFAKLCRKLCRQHKISVIY